MPACRATLPWPRGSGANARADRERKPPSSLALLRWLETAKTSGLKLLVIIFAPFHVLARGADRGPRGWAASAC